MTQTRTESITAPDGGRFAGHLALPSGGHGPGLLLIQEVFGVNAYVRDVAERLAHLGYVVLAPDVFWRSQPGFELDSSDQATIGPAVEMAGTWDPEVGLDDLSAAVRHLQELPEVTGAVGVIGFCFGGTQAFRLAATGDLTCAVSYYGSGVAELFESGVTPQCPIMFHFGDNDPYLPNEQVAVVKTATADDHRAVVHVHHGAGHAFDNHLAPHFSDPAAAEAAWSETAAFLFTHLGGPGIGA
jgi:carboxymethylenebutenolidase